MKQTGMLSSWHPEMGRDSRAAIQWDPTGLAVRAPDGGFKIATDKLPMVVTAGMGGIAADEVFHDLPRSTTIILISGSLVQMETKITDT